MSHLWSWTTPRLFLLGLGILLGFETAIKLIRPVVLPGASPALDTVIDVAVLALLGLLAVRPLIKARQQAEQALCQSDTRYKTLMENLQIGTSVVDREHNVLRVNQQLAQMLGRRPADLLVRKCFQVFEGREAICPHCPATRALATGEPQECEIANVPRGDGGQVVVHLRVVPLAPVDGVSNPDPVRTVLMPYRNCAHWAGYTLTIDYDRRTPQCNGGAENAFRDFSGVCGEYFRIYPARQTH